MDINTVLLGVGLTIALVLLTARRVRSSTEYSRKEYIRKSLTDGFYVSILFFALVFPDLTQQVVQVLESTPTFVYGSVAIVMSALISVSLFTEKVPNAPSIIGSASMLTAIVFVIRMLNRSDSWFDFYILDEILGVFIGVFAWLLITLLFTKVTESIVYLRSDATDDTGEYGDNHIVGDILGDDDS